MGRVKSVADGFSGKDCRVRVRSDFCTEIPRKAAAYVRPFYHVTGSYERLACKIRAKQMPSNRVASMCSWGCCMDTQHLSS